MNTELPKKLSLDIMLFIESVVFEYNLEKDFIDGDVLLKEKMSDVTDLAERISNKFLYSQQIISHLKNDRPLEEILVSFKIKKIIEQLVNKIITFEDLHLLLSQSIKASPEIIKSIEEKIKVNPQIKNAIESEIEGLAEEKIDDEEVVNEKTNTKSIGNILLKGD